MAYTLLSNKKNGKTTLYFSAALGNAVVNIAGNNAVSDIAIFDEILTSGNINMATWGTDSGSVQVLRGANTVLVLSGSGHQNYVSTGVSLTNDNNASLVVNFVGTSNAHLIINIQKVGILPTTY